MTRCVVYAAKSTADEHGSIPAQLARCREHAERQGWAIAGEYHDEAASAYRGSRGPGLVAARAHAAELAAGGEEVVLLVFASDRLARGDGRTATHLAEYVLEGMKAGYRIESVTEDLGGEMGLVLAALYGERAHADSRAKSEHTKAGKRRAAERGRRNGGPRPFGYRHVPCLVDGKPSSSLEIVPSEAAAVRRMFTDVTRGKSQATIARELNAAGIATVRGAAWSQSRVGQTLRNPLYVGKVHYGAELFDGAHEPIVSLELWQAVEQIRVATAQRRGKGGGRKPKGPHLLTGGLLRCSCGASMRARTEPKSYGTWEAYLCGGRHSGRTTDCTMPALLRAEVDDAVWRYFETVGLDYDAMVREDDESRALRRSEVVARIAEAERELATVTEQFERIRGDYRAGRLDATDWQSFRDEIAAEQEAAAAALDQLRANAEEIASEETLRDAEAETLAALVSIRETLAGIVTGAADLDAARAALRRVFESFSVHRYGEAPAGVLDADLAAADWYIVPEVRADVILSPLVIDTDEHGEPAVVQELEIRKTAIQSGGKLSASRP
jgi:site-specific DNA recombinase